ncbi:TPA: LemA domain protein [Bacillus cytotoxicus]|uniref:LemA domain protein n=1 Tax=Bacillus cytotoxicus TaxID=580165 RepID=UPI001AEE14FD|nr:LemA domain protein [Bacillus cytotoxicus]QTR72691.1 LemA domain protein [Bacillus cytotoxicus]HDR4570144.1 LemA domain protein [Bacillus cytotoxicus]HDR4573656.1 LemA domain protein [Bacillus cytotoxicus]HDR4585955.1 LemA domain protein [Bacillus cytotoxicus]HDR4589752.1 LemA domain protein [Bacillus cytotoxicus]
MLRRDEYGRKKQLVRIIELTNDLRKVLVQESFFNHHPELRGVIENLAGSVETLANLHHKKDENAEDRLRYVLAKLKIAHNAILQEKQTFSSH